MPAARRATPTATHAQRFMPVNGSVRAPVEVPDEPVELELAGDVEVLLEEACEVELPLLDVVLAGAVDVDDVEVWLWAVLVVVVSGSTYC